MTGPDGDCEGSSATQTFQLEDGGPAIHGFARNGSLRRDRRPIRPWITLRTRRRSLYILSVRAVRSAR